MIFVLLDVYKKISIRVNFLYVILWHDNMSYYIFKQFNESVLLLVYDPRLLSNEFILIVIYICER